MAAPLSSPGSRPAPGRWPPTGFVSVCWLEFLKIFSTPPPPTRTSDILFRGFLLPRIVVAGWGRFCGGRGKIPKRTRSVSFVPGRRGRGGGGRPLLASGGWRLRGGRSSSFFRVHELGERKREREWVRVAKSIARIFLGPGTPDFCNANLLYFIVFFSGVDEVTFFPGKTVLEWGCLKRILLIDFWIVGWKKTLLFELPLGLARTFIKLKTRDDALGLSFVNSDKRIFKQCKLVKLLLSCCSHFQIEAGGHVQISIK